MAPNPHWGYFHGPAEDLQTQSGGVGPSQSPNPLLTLNSTRQRSITDRMIKMMEQYTDNLEDIVAERSEQLALEKEKADNLLCRMLPK